jgi:hypothetical protein
LQVRFLENDFCLRFLRCYRPDIDQFAHAELTRRLDEHRQTAKENAIDCKRRMTNAEERLKDAKKAPTESWRSQQRQQYQKEYERTKDEMLRLIAANQKLFAQDPIELNYRFTPTFEIQGIDVLLAIEACTTKHGFAVPLRGHIFLSLPREDALRYTMLAIEIKPVIGDDYPTVLRQMHANGSCVLLVGDYTGIGATREQFIRTFATAQIKIVFLADVACLANTAE